jgi:spore coat polysaccharide biosynthesis protein SpsF
MKKYLTDQEKFWAGDFGTQYIKRNASPELLASNLNFFSRALNHAGRISSCLEFGANIGMNSKALKLLYPKIRIKGVEINKVAAKELSKVIGVKNVFLGSIFDYPVKEKVDLTLTKGVLIHINPKKLDLVYEKLYQSSNNYILVCEYYNPSPTTVSYVGYSDRLFKRDFAGELLDKYPDLKLIDYGFSYRRDNTFIQDDITWFLLKKQDS